MTHTSNGSQLSLEDDSRFLTREQCRAILERCATLATGGGETTIRFSSWWSGTVKWALNRAHVSSDLYETTLGLSRKRRGALGTVSTQQIDDEGLVAAVHLAEERMRYARGTTQFDTRPTPLFQRELLTPKLWSEPTAKFTGELRGELVRRLIASAEAAGLRSAGELSVRVGCNGFFDTRGMARYYPSTRVAFSTTVRDADGTGSGWAGTDDYDVDRIHFEDLTKRALEKCRTSVNPVRLEPGRYTTILEPQAVADLLGPIMNTGVLNRLDSETRSWMPFYRREGLSKITERIVDTRLSVSSDPMDPEGGFVPFNVWNGDAYYPVSWIKNGVLEQLQYSRHYGLMFLDKDAEMLNPQSWRMAGGTTSTEEMIATTKRGLLVTRLQGVEVTHFPSQTCSGYTRDGLWLIEDGKITKPVKNFRFIESPLLALNRVEQIGAPQRVFSETGSYGGKNLAWVAPTLKVHDFNFAQLTDAV